MQHVEVSVHLSFTLADTILPIQVLGQILVTELFSTNVKPSVHNASSWRLTKCVCVCVCVGQISAYYTAKEEEVYL